MNKKLNSLNKSELLKIISNMKKKDLINIIETKFGGSEEIIKETSSSSRKAIVFDKNKVNKKMKRNISFSLVRPS